MLMINEAIVLDGVSLKASDFSIEEKKGIFPHNDAGLTPISTPTELGEVVGLINKDVVTESRLSTIDFNSRIYPAELSYIVGFESLVGLRCIPTRCLILTRSKKRNSVSLMGLGRKEVVELTVGKRQMDSETRQGFGEKFKNFLGIKQKEQ